MELTDNAITDAKINEIKNTMTGISLEATRAKEVADMKESIKIVSESNDIMKELWSISKDFAVIEKMQEETTIIATEQNKELISIFFKANSIPDIEVDEYRCVVGSYVDPDDGKYISTEKYYMAISIKYPQDDPTSEILLLNLVAKHHGLNNMLFDYLQKLNVSPITVVRSSYVKSATPKECTDNFLTNVVPKLKKTYNGKKVTIHKNYGTN
jgi:hypothetical protein